MLDRGQYSGAVLDELESQNDAQVEGIMGKVKILKEVSPQANPLLFGLRTDEVLDDGSHRRRDPRLIRPRREDERRLRTDATAAARHHEPDAADGGEDRRRLARLAGLFRRRHHALHIRLALLIHHPTDHGFVFPGKIRMCL